MFFFLSFKLDTNSLVITSKDLLFQFRYQYIFSSFKSNTGIDKKKELHVRFRIVEFWNGTISRPGSLYRHRKWAIFSTGLKGRRLSNSWSPEPGPNSRGSAALMDADVRRQMTFIRRSLGRWYFPVNSRAGNVAGVCVQPQLGWRLLSTQSL